MGTLRRVAFAAADAVIYLWLATMWVGSASAFTLFAARRAWGEGSAVFAAAQRVAQCAFLLSLPLTLLAPPLAATRAVCPYNAEEEYIKTPAPEIPHRSTIGVMMWHILHEKVLLGLFLCVPVAFLMHVGGLMEGSQSERIGSLLTDAGSLGTCVLHCFLISPALILKTWRMK